MLPLSFKPKNKCELIRNGSKNDGGYLIEKQSFIKSKFSYNSNNIELPNKLDAPNNIHKKINLKFNN